MDYAELYESDGFQRNMRRTPWTKLFPHWWSENDALLNAIGDEIERLKAQAIFTLLNAGIKPPVMIWKNSLVNKEHIVEEKITQIPAEVEVRAPFYKTWGVITLTNNTEDDIDGLKITFDDKNGFAINQLISQSDKITINLYNNQVSLNGKQIKTQTIGEGMPYFITSQYKEKYEEGIPLHNEIVRLKIDTNEETKVVKNTINIPKDLSKWNIVGNAYIYNPDKADSWIALNDESKINYELNFTNIKKLTFWYKATESNSILNCYINNKIIFSKKIEDTSWHNYIINVKEIKGNRTVLNFLTGEKISDEEYTIYIAGTSDISFEVSSKSPIYINELKYDTEEIYKCKCDIDINIQMDNVVFIDEQNIEITGLELIPIERVELYANYDFDYNSDYNGWRKVYQKKYDETTNVIYDMITTHFFTKEFYVDVWFKTLQYPYKVGFPCYQDAESSSMYHVNNRLDTWGSQLGLERRNYKKNINEKDYYATFPEYYPFDIEQDFWYYSRLINEYTWNNNAINNVDLVDNNEDNILRLYSINPFCEDFVVHAKTLYPTEKELIDYNQYSPNLITQQNSIDNNQQIAYNNIINLLTKDNNSASITLNNNTNNNDVIYKKRYDRTKNIYQYIERESQIRNKETLIKLANEIDMQNDTNLSKELITYFDLSDLPENVNIDNIEIIIEGDSSDNKTDKFTTDKTGLLIPDLNNPTINLSSDSSTTSIINPNFEEAGKGWYFNRASVRDMKRARELDNITTNDEHDERYDDLDDRTKINAHSGESSVYASKGGYIKQDLNFDAIDNISFWTYPIDIDLEIEISIDGETYQTINDLTVKEWNEISVDFPSLTGTHEFRVIAQNQRAYIDDFMTKPVNNFIPLNPDNTYQLKKRDITFSNTNFLAYRDKIIESGDNYEVTQTALIRKFTNKLSNKLLIPFTLTERDTEVTDINKVYLYFDNILKEGKIVTDEYGRQCIECDIPLLSIYTQITIVIKSKTHAPFTTTIDIKKENVYKYVDKETGQTVLIEEIKDDKGEYSQVLYYLNDDGNKDLIEDEITVDKIVDYQQITGPIVEGIVTDTQITEDWRTNDLRNVLQRQGIYFRHILENDNAQSFTSVFLYNIALKIYYSPKKSSFEIKTRVDTKDAILPDVGTYYVSINNIGDKPLNTTVDIFNPSNITLEKNNIPIHLNPNDGIDTPIKIKANYPIIDGFYEILATCEDKTCSNTVQVFADGLIKTGISLKPHYGKYYENITLEATISAIDGSIINGGVNEVQFYINGYAVGSPVIVKNNEAKTTIIPGDYNFTETGSLKLEARFLGTNKYASSRGQSIIFISKNSTRITVDAPNKAIRNTSYEAKAKVEYYNGEEYLPVDDGAVEFYINDEILGLSNLNDNETYRDGYFIINVDKIENPIGDYTLHVRYVGSNQYASTEEALDFEIIGGNVSIYGYDETAKPHDIIQLKAQIVDANKKNIPYGYADFIIKEINKEIINVPVENGIAITPEFELEVNIEDNETKILDVIIKYHGVKNEETKGHLDGTNENDPSHIIVKKAEVYFEYPSLYNGSQYEPLGFWVKVCDIETGEPINDGNITITLPYQNNVSVEANIDKDGIARLVYNPITFSAAEWNQLNKFKFTTANYNKNILDIEADTNIISDINEEYDSKNLYKIYDGNKIDIYETDNLGNNTNIGLVNFTYEDGKLYIIGVGADGREIKEHVFISEDGCLYSRTTFDDLRTYNIGLQNIIINYYSQKGQYISKKVTLENMLNISEESIDLDIHSYDLTYTDTDNIICYATKYSHSIDSENYIEDSKNDLINTGSVEFLIDDSTLSIVKVAENGQAKLNNDILVNIAAGNHLMRVRYLPDGSNLPTTNSYSLINLKQAVPIISMKIDRKTKGRKSNITVCLKTNNYDIPLTGIINLYMNNEVIDTYYLYGNEVMPGIVDYGDSDNGESIEALSKDLDYVYVNFIVTLPDDIDINEYTFDAEYLGNEFFNEIRTTSENNLVIKQEPAPVTLTVDNLNKDISLDAGIGETCILDIDINVFTNNDNKYLYDDIINEGRVALYYGDDLIATDNVSKNYAQLKWVLDKEGEHQYTLKYENGINYIHGENGINNYKIIKINGITPLSQITVPKKYSTIKQALMCLEKDGTIIIDNEEEKDTEIILSKSLDITKSCNIIGVNKSSIIKDAIDLVTDFNDIHVYSTENLDLNNLYEIIGLEISNLNINDFILEDNELYYKNNGTKIQIFFADNNKFYANTHLLLDNINSDININIAKDIDVHINNITFKSNDNTKNTDFVINNEGYLVINHSIITSSIKLINNGTLMAQRNLMYCKCIGEADLNNNWWGSNKAPYNVENNIILQVEAQNTPPVISEDIILTGKFIGKNGREYDLPSANFNFTADTGYFSIDKGELVNNEITTTYFDAEKEGNIYFTVDNETISYPVYEYERKTEVIIDNINEIPINYQTTIEAKVQSCADTYYIFDENNNVTKNSETINDGYVTFYIDNKKVGKSKVQDGYATISVYFTDLYYNTNDIYKLKAVYDESNYYFSSQSNININLLKERDTDIIYYVSAKNGNDKESGLYSAPVQTIQHAIDSNADIIYLLDNECNETQIEVSKNVIIKSYKNSITFTNIEDGPIFNISANNLLNIQKINLINNLTNNLINNEGTIEAQECIFYKNQGQIFKTNNIDAKYCAIVDNELICNKIENKGDCFEYCWFGINDAQSIDKNINKNIIMTTNQSKDNIYIGTLVHITAELIHYKDGDFIYNLNELLPLRIAKFATDYGSMKPITDYTYSNKSVSLLNTNENNNTIQYILELPENKNYTNSKISVSCYVKDVFGNKVTSTILNNNTLKMSIYNNSGTIINRIETIKDGIATTTIDSLPLGKYNIDCIYENNEQYYTINGSFTVQKPEIIVKNINMGDGSRLYNTYINAELKDNFGKQLEDINIDISIDNVFIKKYACVNSNIETNLLYNLLEEGEHVLTLSCTEKNSKYSNFEYNYIFNVTAQNTYIDFNYTKIEANINNQLKIEVRDEQNNYVQEGAISIDIDNEDYIDNKKLINGTALIELNIKEVGQHNIVIYYSGADKYYKESINVKNIGVGIFNVVFGLNEYVKADIGYDLSINTTIKDVSDQLVNQGYVNIYIDDALINESVILVNNGIIRYEDALPTNIAAGKHNLTLEYIDNVGAYLTTYLNTYLIIGQIPTEIIMDTIFASPNISKNINYTISTEYGDAKTGILTAKYNDNIIGKSIVTDSLTNQITINTPFLPVTSDYEITFDYHDDEETYADSEINTRLVIQKDTVQIQPSHTWYYPNKEFQFSASFTDNEDKIINVGQASLYIDNVKETESIDIVNGQITVPLSFSKAKSFPITIVYEDNNYYKQTTFSFDFIINSIDMNNISIKNIINSQENILYLENDIVYSIQNQEIKLDLLYDTLDNYNVTDGIVDILIDNKVINTYYVAESNKYVTFNTENISKGNHILTLKYHDSSLFNDFSKDYTLKIIAKTINIEIVNTTDKGEILVSPHNDTIEIATHISEQVNGLLKYYIGIPTYKANEVGDTYLWEYDYKFIGLDDIQNREDITYQYILSSSLLNYAEDKDETKYKIKAVFEGNDYYDSNEDEVDLHIEKTDCNITFDNEIYNVAYKDIITINFNIDAKGEQLVQLSIGNDDIGYKNIGSIVTSNNKGSVTYKMNSSLVVKETPYLLIAHFAGSALNNSADANAEVYVHAATPIMNISDMEAYKAGTLTLDNVLTDVDGVVIASGTISYNICDTDNNILFSTDKYSLNKKVKITLPDTIIDDKVILQAIYTSEDMTKYSGFTKEVNLNLNKNDIILNINLPDDIYCEEEFTIDIQAYSNTTSIPINLNIDYKKMEDNE